MVHFFRAEISRANVWRQRLDATTNWAVVTTGAAISVSFSGPIGQPALILLTMLLVTMFLAIEARRYRYYELWSSRVRLMETDFFAAMLVPPFRPDPDWAESLAESLLQPHFPISTWEAVGRRLRRNYLWMYLVLELAWFVNIWLQPTVASSWEEILNRAKFGPLSGWVTMVFSVAFMGAVILVSVLTAGMHEATGEVFPRYGVSTQKLHETITMETKAPRWRAWFRQSRHRQQLIALIITDKAKGVSDRILSEMRRGVTALSGTGMYTGQAHSVLLCALTVTEVGQLKALVRAEDPGAFVIVSPAQEIIGRGFSSLQEEG